MPQPRNSTRSAPKPTPAFPAGAPRRTWRAGPRGEPGRLRGLRGEAGGRLRSKTGEGGASGPQGGLWGGTGAVVPPPRACPSQRPRRAPSAEPQPPAMGAGSPGSGRSRVPGAAAVSGERAATTPEGGPLRGELALGRGREVLGGKRRAGKG